MAWPSLRRWAAECPMSVNTLRKHLETALLLGWVSLQRGTGKLSHLYRAAVPANLPLSEKDEELADALVSRVGEIEPCASLHSDTRAPHVSLMRDTQTSAGTARPSELTVEPSRVSNSAAPVCPTDPYLVSTAPSRVSAISRNLLSDKKTPGEVLREVLSPHRKEEGALSRTVCSLLVSRAENRSPEFKEQKETTVNLRKAIVGAPQADDATIRAMVRGASLEDVRAAREALAAGRHAG